jgi:DNA processing protein
VCGLAEGIDAAAHTTAVDAGGRTIAVIGTPLSATYPAKHRELQRLLMSEHLVVSQFPTANPTERRNFPLRNRTMALSSDASVIVEASDGSGTA